MERHNYLITNKQETVAYSYSFVCFELLGLLKHN